MQTPVWQLRRLDANHPVASFTCGTRPGAAEIDAYLRQGALLEQSAGLAMVWIVEDVQASDPSHQIVGFFTLSPVSVRLNAALLSAVGISAPYASIGGWLLGRLGLAARHQGRAHGAWLVASAIAAARRLRHETAGPLLVVDPKNASLLDWYLGLDFGFRRLAPQDPRSLRLVLKL